MHDLTVDLDEVKDQVVQVEPPDEIPTVYGARAKIANASRFDDDLRLADAHRDMRVAKAKRAIEAAVAGAPPPTPGQIVVLRSLLAD